METDIRGIIINRLEDIKKTEQEFDYSFGWKNVNFSYKNRNKQKTSHVSLVDFYSLDDKDLVIFFEYILLMRSDIQIELMN